ncbi:hypothetical protein [Deinococcus soli (ex Cha et al. 2016)]|uniref:Uncharacterized protein n=2 Tax=Deinococcus soli (ex Cha et al. 2016) TaxID=1309411 RepID=A0AAE3XCA3_9DEIO|nr:hypothetical protein [Deinococcus soli (ex Cha et al. 2016)]MDR6219225.1 hypothetical protein [Deinococcus soli (ex Cha et al. 2016)]MDR6329474.1 hypothetical protein [Deinococcus soli (ex Cha et al. 2016)]MDR6752134.1 hypothetical protein [Deinococcus soli (ex Cha et al. 2016)]
MQARELHLIVARLSAAQPITDAFENETRVPGAQRPWYSSQKSHIGGWLSEYGQGGAYNRKHPGKDARHFYTHFQCAPGLLWLAEALGEDSETLRRGVEVIRAAGPKGAAQCGAFRKVVPWERIQELIARRGTQS